MSHDMDTNKDVGTVDNVIYALQKVIGLLDRIKKAIEESSGKIPTAAVQLHTVTQATENATVEILNVLDLVTQKITTAEASLEVLKPLIKTAEQEAAYSSVAKVMSEVKDDATNVTLSLQVQDITAQKIAAANHLIESVRVELLHELQYFETANQKPIIEEKPRSGAFDNDATYHKSEDQQKRIDQVVTEWREKQSSNEKKPE
jgi:chemotaxis regulatin CheY-phosphate phosphatase CheZ